MEVQENKSEENTYLAGFNYTFMDHPSPKGECLVVYISGCEHKCKDCHNDFLQPFDVGYKLLNANELYFKIMDSLGSDTSSIVFEGGDPLHPKHANTVLSVCAELSRKGYKVGIYTGYSIKYVIRHYKNYLQYLNFIKTGVYDCTKLQKVEKTDSYMALASTNQKMYIKGFDDTFYLVSNKGKIQFY